MNSRQPGVRQRVVEAAAAMLAQHGLNAASIREMTKRADAPFGSTYHHFPGGKQQVVVEAVNMAGARVSAALEGHLQSGSVAGLSSFMADWRATLLRSNFRIGCPVMAAAVEEPLDDIASGALDAAAQVFKTWETLLATSLLAHGCDRSRAAQLATLVIASVEGAIVLCRAQRSIEPFDLVCAQLIQIVDAPCGVRRSAP
ncbi:TetR/AcrR family transcriptional regulator [Pseudomonas amygdali]|uniref:TetR/AcrR family transcriptional regulator n=1 Tax=Pseudomonas amygdali TaxID=47877 RepID=UPI001CD8F62E|nr:TetR/AcrR family transcriptional regulator [Pseudomonas amygdali]UBT80435.1 TetR/AcrR family transcriptional regulator [Pseudomonas amygdali]